MRFHLARAPLPRLSFISRLQKGAKDPLVVVGAAASQYVFRDTFAWGLGGSVIELVRRPLSLFAL
jgi:hypothetical protein